MNALVSLQRGSLGEVFATHVAAVGLVARVAHTVAQQALGVGEGLGAYLYNDIHPDESSHSKRISCKGINEAVMML